MAGVYGCRQAVGACISISLAPVKCPMVAVRGLDRINNMLVFLLRLGLPPSISDQPAALFSNTVWMQL